MSDKQNEMALLLGFAGILLVAMLTRLGVRSFGVFTVAACRSGLHFMSRESMPPLPG